MGYFESAQAEEDLEVIAVKMHDEKRTIMGAECTIVQDVVTIEAT